jgi:hypothetical protein
MSRRDAVVLAARVLALLLTVWAVTDISYLPASVFSYLRYSNELPLFSPARNYWGHYHLISLGFLIIRIIGFSLVARWLYRCGPDVEELLLPSSLHEVLNSQTQITRG